MSEERAGRREILDVETCDYPEKADEISSEREARTPSLWRIPKDSQQVDEVPEKMKEVQRFEMLCFDLGNTVLSSKEFYWGQGGLKALGDSGFLKESEVFIRVWISASLHAGYSEGI